ncbi:MAG: hypothetical protein U0414_41550 [Polyangiaceae bacterium]
MVGRSPLLSVALTIGMLGCTAGTNGVGGAGGTGSTASSPTMSGGTTSGFAQSNGSTGTGFGTASTGSSMDNCSEASKLVYVFSSDNEIYSFDPPSKKFTLLGSPDCNAGGAQPNSMAVDRNLVAWINYIGSVHTVSLDTLTGCKKALDLQAPYQQIGMGFATNAVGSTDETLFIDGIQGGGLAKIDTVSKTVTPIGAFSNDPNLQGQSAELTGTGDARLFGYFTTNPVRVAQIDKSNANIVSDNTVTGFPTPSSWAFSFWGGALYLYAADTFNNSRVIRYVPGTNDLDTNYIPDVGFTIVGAGVSTCAPTVPPS